MANVWTHGVWTVAPGREEEFVALWSEMAERAAGDLNTAGRPTLLRDRDRPNEFISFGPWPSVDEASRFRASDAFRLAQQRMSDVVESFVTRTLDEVRHG